MDEEKKNQEEQQSQEDFIKEIEKQLEEAESPEEIMEIINKINEANPNGEVKLIQNKKHSRRWILYLLLEAILSFGIMLGTVGLLQPFTLKMEYGDIYFMLAVVVLQMLTTVVLRIFHNPYILMFREVIKDIILFVIIFGLVYVLPFVEFISEYDECSFAFIFLISKSAIMTFVQKIQTLKKVQK